MCLIRRPLRLQAAMMSLPHARRLHSGKDSLDQLACSHRGSVGGGAAWMISGSGLFGAGSGG